MVYGRSGSLPAARASHERPIDRVAPLGSSAPPGRVSRVVLRIVRLHDDGGHRRHDGITRPPRRRTAKCRRGQGSLPFADVTSPRCALNPTEGNAVAGKPDPPRRSTSAATGVSSRPSASNSTVTFRLPTGSIRAASPNPCHSGIGPARLFRGQGDVAEGTGKGVVRFENAARFVVGATFVWKEIKGDEARRRIARSVVGENADFDRRPNRFGGPPGASMGSGCHFTRSVASGAVADRSIVTRFDRRGGASSESAGGVPPIRGAGDADGEFPFPSHSANDPGDDHAPSERIPIPWPAFEEVDPRRGGAGSRITSSCSKGGKVRGVSDCAARIIRSSSSHSAERPWDGRGR